MALVFLLSPGPRSGLGGPVALLGNIGVAGVRDWVLSFGALSPVSIIAAGLLVAAGLIGCFWLRHLTAGCHLQTSVFIPFIPLEHRSSVV